MKWLKWKQTLQWWLPVLTLPRSEIQRFLPLRRKENSSDVFLGTVYLTVKLQDFIKQLILMLASQMLSFIACAMERDLPFPWSRQSPAIYLAALLLSAGMVVVIRMTPSHFYFLLINRRSTQLLRIMRKLSIAVHHMVLYLVVAMTSIYLTTQTRTKAVLHILLMLVVVIPTICLLLQVKANLYWLMANKTSKLLRLKYTLCSDLEKQRE